jgi:hypothetical protein
MESRRAGLRAYLAASRDPLTSLVLVLPLFVLYQIGILLTGGVRNGADFVTDLLMRALGGDVSLYLAFNAVVLVAFLVAIGVLRKRGHVHGKLVPWILLESAVYALFFGSAVVLMMRSVGLDALLAAGAPKQAHGPLEAVVLSVGAGLYEETVFRLALMGGIFWVLHKPLGTGRFASAAVALLISSVVFSLVHHVGALGEPFTMGAFAYRFFAGVLLAFIFQTRGFAVAVYTHALYDVYVMVLRG